MSNENYKGSIELASGLKPKNNGNFPLIEAHSVAFYNEDGTEIRLDEKIEQVGVSEEDRAEIINSAVSKVETGQTITAMKDNIQSNMDAIGSPSTADADALYPKVESLESALEKLTGDNDVLRLKYDAENGSVLYLYSATKDENGNITNEDLNTDPDTGNVITSAIVTGGGGGGNVASYSLTLKVLDKSTAISILKGGKATINFDAVLTSVEDPETPITAENITLYLYVNDVLQKTVIQRAGVGSLDVSDYVSVGSNNIKLTASYTETLENGESLISRSTKRWTIDVIDMYIKSTFDDSVEVFTGAISYNYTPYGILEKTIYFKLDGKDLIDPVVTSLSNKAMSVTIPMQTHGSHTFEVYCTGVIGGAIIESSHLYYDIMFNAGEDTPIIRAVPSNLTGMQYATIPIEYTVYDPKNEIATVILKEDGVQKSSLNVSRVEQTWNYRASTEGTKILTLESGGTIKELTLEIEEFPYTISPVTDGLELDFNPAGRTNQDSDYKEFRNAAIDAEGNEISIDWEISDNFDWVNGGWKTDENGDSYFCIKAGTSVVVNYLLFNDNDTVAKSTTDANNNLVYSKGNGKEFKIVFKTTNTAQSQGTWLSCLAPAVNENNTGIQMDIQNAYVSSNLDTLTIPYSEDDIIEFDMNIVPTSFSNNEIDFTIKDIPMIMTYEDGTPAQPKIITSASTSFKQVKAVPITIGSQYCDVHIYRMKAYRKYLSDEGILNNFIADARSAEEMVDRYLRNQVYDPVTTKLTPESLAEACPDLRVIVISAPRFTNDKKDKVENTSVRWIYKNGTRPEDNWTATGAIHNGQGTSSNKYGYAGRNLEINLKKAKITLSDGTVVKKVSLTDSSVPTNYFNFKANIASSENANNALMQKRFNRYLPYKSAAQLADPKVKNTMEFFNCVVFIQETSKQETAEDETRQEFLDNEIHFYSIGNIGDSKKTDNTRVNDKDDPMEFCVEIMDWNRPLSNFPINTLLDASTIKNEDGEYLFLLDKNLGEDGILLELIDGEYVLSKDETINPAKTYYVDALANDDFSEDFTYGFRYVQSEFEEGDKAEDGHELTKDEAAILTEQFQAPLRAKWIEFYKFITRDLTTNGVEDSEKVAAWKAEFPRWFIQDAALYYYLFTLRYTMVDNRAKNSFWHYGRMYISQAEVDSYNIALDKAQTALSELQATGTASEEELASAQTAVNNAQNEVDRIARFIVNDAAASYNNGYRFDFWDYDNDTTLGIDNAGKLEMSYGVEDLDRDEAGAYYFRAADSTFFVRIAKYFEDELEDMFGNLESKNSSVFSSSSLINEWDTWQNEFPEELWRLDYERKYKRTYVGGSGEEWDNAIGKTPELQFLSEMMNGKKKYQRRQFEKNQDIYMSSKFMGSVNKADFFNLRGQGAIDSTGWAVPHNYDITITPYSKMYINLENGTDSRYYHRMHEAGIPVTIPYPTEKMDFIYAYGASQIQSLGDLSPMYLQTATMGAGSRLKEVILGNQTEGYSNLAFETLNIGNTNKLLEDLHIEQLAGLKGTLPISNIPSLKRLYAQGTNISSIPFANNGSIEEAYLPASLTDLQLNNLYYLTTLEIESYDKLATLMVNNCPNIDVLNLVEQSVNLKSIRIIDINWELKDATLLNRLLACSDYGNLETQSVLTGKVKLESIRQSEIEAFTNAWPNLELIYEDTAVVPQHELRFWRDSNDAEPIYSILVDHPHTLIISDDPSAQLIENGKLFKDSTAQYNYTFKSWDSTWTSNLGKVITKDMDFYAEWDSQIRTYTVSWLNDKGGTIIINENGDQAVQTVEYGNEAIFDISLFELPVKTDKNRFNFYLFKEWSESTGSITGDTVVYPIWETSNTSNPIGKESLSLSAAEIHALSSLGLGNSDFSETIGDGDSITLEMGYMPDYSETGYEGIVLVENPIIFDGTGTNVFESNYSLFDKDKDFVLAIDFTMGYGTTGKDNVLVSCGGTLNVQRGFNLYTTSQNTVPILKWNADTSVAVSAKTPTSEKTYRDICVIRHKKGDPNLYVYTHDRFSMVEVQCNELISSATNSISHKICFGAQNTSESSFSNYGTGSINYAKLWFVDLGDEECRKICCWTKDTITFSRAATEKYGIAGTEKNTTMSFVADNLLEETMQFDTDNYKGGWEVSDLRVWIQTKFLKAVSVPWQQIIKPVYITSLYGSINENTSASTNEKIEITEDKIYIPAYADLYSNAVNDKVYGKESSSIYSIFDNQTDRIRTYPDGTPGIWWTRTPKKSTGRPAQIGVNAQGGFITEGYWQDTSGTTAVQYFLYKDRTHGILLGFSIGEA